MVNLIDGVVFSLRSRYSATPCMWVSTGWWVTKGVTPESDPVIIVFDRVKTPSYVDDILGKLYHTDGVFDVVAIDNAWDDKGGVYIRTKGGTVLADLDTEVAVAKVAQVTELVDEWDLKSHGR